MSRVRISPTEWRLEEPASAHLTGHAFAVSAVTIPDMRPVLQMAEPREWRRMANAEAAKRYRERQG